jgi:hypothetical protein
MTVLLKILKELKLCTSDCVGHLGCGEGRWITEIAIAVKCKSIGWESYASGGTGSSGRLLVSQMEYEFERRAEEQGVVNQVEYNIVDDLLEADISECSCLFINCGQTGVSALRSKVETELSELAACVVIGGEIPGWASEWKTVCRGVPINIYYRREDRNGALEKAENELNNFETDCGVATLGREESLIPNFKFSVYTPHR